MKRILDLPLLSVTLYGATVATWSIVVVLTVLFTIIFRRVTTLAAKRARRLPDFRDVGLKDLVVETLERTSILVLAPAALLLAGYIAEVPSSVLRNLHSIFIFALLIQAGVWASSFITYFANRHLKSTDHAGRQAVLGLLSTVARGFTWVVVILLILDNIGIDITALIAGLGLGGIAVALAVQKVLGDLLASISIVLDKPFEVGDFIIVGDFLGTVERIGMKTTRVKSLSGEQLILPNSDLLSSRIRNCRRMYDRRVVLTLSVTLDTPIEKVEALPARFKEIIQQVERTRFDRAHFAKISNSSFDFEIVYYVLNPDFTLHMDVQQQILLNILKCLATAEVNLSTPIQKVLVEGEKKNPFEPEM